MKELLKDAQTYEYTSMRYLDIEEIQINSGEHILWAAKSIEVFSNATP
ncbi:hypothetical protein [Fontibacillus sp. BL9]